MLLNPSKTLILLAIFLLISFTNPVFGKDDDDGDDEEIPRSCYKYTTDFIKNTVDTLLKCTANFKPKSIFDYGTRFYCIFKCVFQDFGTIDGEGKFDDISAAFFFEENFAPEVQATLLPEVQACFVYAEQFDNKDYWCKTYSPFISCVIKVLVAGVLPYTANCYTSPIIGIVFSFFTNVAPDPLRVEVSEELKRAMRKNKLKCYNRNCTTTYKIEKKNGTSSIILYDRNRTEISRRIKTPKNNTISLKNEEISRAQQTPKYNYYPDRYL